MKSKNLSLVMALVLGVVFGACGGHDGIDPTTTMTKAEAQAFNSADWGYDVCEQNGWYNDGVCDEFCPLPDPDCQEPEGVHKPVCKWIGTLSEGWYWEDTDELINYETCGSMPDPECWAIGTMSEGWYIYAGQYNSHALIVWDMDCHRTMRIALEGEACGGSIGYSCHDGLYCQGLPVPVPGEDIIGGSGICRSIGTCETAPDCLVEGNEWPRPMCVGYAGCEAGQCVWHCGVIPGEELHKPVCQWIGSYSEGWYWEDTNELIKYEFCGSMSDPECGAIGSWSEGWYTDAGLIIWDICHRTVRIALEGETCGGSIGYSCHDGLYCQGLPVWVPGEDIIGGSGICRSIGTCETTPDCLVEGNEWPRPMCVGYASCNAGQCVWHCDGNPECVDDSDCEYKQEWCEEGECVPCSNAGLYCTLYCEHGFVNRNGCIPCVCAEPSIP